MLELAYPPDLLADVIQDAAPVVIITHESETGKIREGVPLIVLDESPDVQHNGTNGVNGCTEASTEHTTGVGTQAGDNDLDRLAFVAYSSGTTASQI